VNGLEPGVGGRILARTLGSAAATLWLAGVGLLTTPFVVLGLGPSAYGVLALASLVAGQLAVLDLGFGSATVLHLAQARAAGDRREQQAVLETSLAVFLAAAFVSGAALLLGAGWLARSVFSVPPQLRTEAEAVLRIGAATLALSFPSSLAAACFQALGRFDWLNGVRAASGTLMAVAPVAVLALGYGLVGVAWAQLTVAALAAAVAAWAVGRLHGAAIRPRPNGPLLRRMAPFGVLVLAGSVAYQWMVNGPPLALAARAGSAELSAFFVPHNLLLKLLPLASAASVAFFPAASAIADPESRPRLAALFASHLRLTFLVLGPLAAFLALFGEPLLAAWIEPGFAAQAVRSLRPLAGVALVLGLSGPPADVARGLRRPQWVLVYALATAALGLAAAVGLAAARGGPGVAEAMLGATLVTTLPFLGTVAWRLLALGPGSMARALAGPAAAVAACAALLALAHSARSDLAMALSAGAAIGTAYALAAWRFVLTPREREVVAGFFPRPRR
jgi:O-antigen/teichoic acid export membrane protein